MVWCIVCIFVFNHFDFVKFINITFCVIFAHFVKVHLHQMRKIKKLVLTSLHFFVNCRKIRNHGDIVYSFVCSAHICGFHIYAVSLFLGATILFYSFVLHFFVKCRKIRNHGTSLHFFVNCKNKIVQNKIVKEPRHLVYSFV